MRRQRGFSLIELLVVLVVVVLMIGFATVQLGDGGRSNQIRWNVRHLADTLSLASDEAQVSGRNRAVALWREDIEAAWQVNWYEQQADGNWEDAQGEVDDAFAPMVLSQGFNADLIIEDEGYLLPEDIDTSETLVEPQLFFFSGGQVTPFELTLWMEQDKSHTYLIRADLLGRISLLESGEDGSS